MKDLTITMPEQDDKMLARIPEPDKEIFNKLKEQYGFNADATAARTFLKLGMMSIVDNDPRHSQSPEVDRQGFEPKTIRELIPEGEENAVDMTNEFWDELLRGQMPDIVENDPEIQRNGYEIYR